MLIDDLENFNQQCQDNALHRICGDKICEAIYKIRQLTEENKFLRRENELLRSRNSQRDVA